MKIPLKLSFYAAAPMVLLGCSASQQSTDSVFVEPTGMAVRADANTNVDEFFPIEESEDPAEQYKKELRAYYDKLAELGCITRRTL